MDKEWRDDSRIESLARSRMVVAEEDLTIYLYDCTASRTLTAVGTSRGSNEPWDS